MNGRRERLLSDGVVALLAALAAAAVATTAFASPAWSRHAAGVVTVETAAAADERLLPLVREALAAALEDLGRQPAAWALELCAEPLVVVHPDLDSYLVATGVPWHVLAVADRVACRIDTQRLLILRDRGGIESTIRHELLHLAQPDSWERWRAEGHALLFARQQPRGAPLDGLSPAQLDALLASPPDQETHLRALATALQWVREGR